MPDARSPATASAWARYDLVVIPNSPDDQASGLEIEYRYDPARPESVLARAQVDDALQTAAGRKNPLPASAATSSEPGARYIDFLIPGLLGMNLMNSGMWGIGFALVDMRQRKLLKRSWPRPCAAAISCWPWPAAVWC